MATPIGTATNVVAMGFIRRPEYLGESVGFLRWCLVGLPITLLLSGGLALWMRLLAPVRDLDLPTLRAYLHEERSKLGPWQRGEVNTLLVFLTVVTLWVTPGVLALVAPDHVQKAFRERCPEEVTALLAPVLLFLLPVDWKRRQFSLEASDFLRVDWGTVLLFGAGLSLGTLMSRTGLAQVVGQWAFDLLGIRDPWAITGLAIASGIVLSQFTSNAAAATALIPVAWGIARSAGVDPIPPLLGVAFGASLGSILPVSTPPNAIVYGSGLVPVRRMVLAGAGLDVLGGVVIWLVLRVAFGLGWTPVAQ
jgi:sodium-dependent dicarboxylate transporter 2/3/5